MNKEEMYALANDKLAEVKEDLKAFKNGVSPATGEPVSKNTANNQMNRLNKEIHHLKVIIALLNGKTPNADDFTAITELRSEKTTSKGTWELGWHISDILMKFPSTSYNKILKRCEAEGWCIDNNGVVEKQN